MRWPFRRDREEPSAPPDEPGPAAWETLPALTATFAPPSPTFKIGSAAKEDLVAPRSPRLTRGLGHGMSADGPPGLVTGLVAPLVVGRLPAMPLLPPVQRRREAVARPAVGDATSAATRSGDLPLAAPPTPGVAVTEAAAVTEATVSTPVVLPARSLVADVSFTAPPRPVQATTPDDDLRALPVVPTPDPDLPTAPAAAGTDGDAVGGGPAAGSAPAPDGSVSESSDATGELVQRSGSEPVAPVSKVAPPPEAPDGSRDVGPVTHELAIWQRPRPERARPPQPQVVQRSSERPVPTPAPAPPVADAPSGPRDDGPAPPRIGAASPEVEGTIPATAAESDPPDSSPLDTPATAGSGSAVPPISELPVQRSTPASHDGAPPETTAPSPPAESRSGNPPSSPHGVQHAVAPRTSPAGPPVVQRAADAGVSRDAAPVVERSGVAGGSPAGLPVVQRAGGARHSVAGSPVLPQAVVASPVVPVASDGGPSPAGLPVVQRAADAGVSRDAAPVVPQAVVASPVVERSGEAGGSPVVQRAGESRHSVAGSPVLRPVVEALPVVRSAADVGPSPAGLPVVQRAADAGVSQDVAPVVERWGEAGGLPVVQRGGGARHSVAVQRAVEADAAPAGLPVAQRSAVPWGSPVVSSGVEARPAADLPGVGLRAPLGLAVQRSLIPMGASPDAEAAVAVERPADGVVAALAGPARVRGGDLPLPLGAVQRSAGGDHVAAAEVPVPAVADVPGAPAVVQMSPAAAAVPTGSTGAAAVPAGGGDDLDELARKLYDRIRWRLRGELRLDMERAGLGAGIRR